MRILINLLLLACIAAGVAVIYVDAQKPVEDVQTNTGVPLRLHMIDEQKLRADLAGGPEDALPEVDGASGPVDAACFVWGPFTTRALRRVEPVLQKAQLMQKMEIADRFLPERYIVYLGPYANEVAVRAFVKQFKQQGFKEVRPIVRGDLAYGVEIKAFKSRTEAQEYLVSGKAPEVQGLRVTNRLGEPSDEVDLIFRGLGKEERTKLFGIWKSQSGTQLKNCSYFGY